MDDSVVADTNRAIEPKMQYTGKVIKLSLAGAVIDIGMEKPAVLHISQIVSPDNSPVKRVEDILTVGSDVQVWVKRVMKKDGEERVELTMLQPLALEWRELKVGNSVKGKVVRLEKFGAFVEIGAERPGLVHISEMAHGYVKLPGDVVKEGDEVEAQILEINRKKKQIKLSIKALQPEPEVVVEEKPKPAPRTTKTFDDSNRERKPARKPRPSGGESNAAIMQAVNASSEPDLTMMELALQEAMQKAKTKRQRSETRKIKTRDAEQEDILERTLKNKVQTD